MAPTQRSASAPGGGSGRHTLYRPPARNGGLPSGQLAKDSSVYELAVKREGDITAYELRIPWSETGGLTPAVGTRAGLSLQLFDADNNGLAPSVMTWGGGLLPEWAPSAFGLLTLIDGARAPRRRRESGTCAPGVAGSGLRPCGEVVQAVQADRQQPGQQQTHQREKQDGRHLDQHAEQERHQG